MAERESKQTKGGNARAEALTAQERSGIARKAALSRWDADIPRADYEGAFRIGDVDIAAAVLANGKRLLTQATFLRALGRSRSPKAGKGVLSTVDGVPFFLQAEALKPFIDADLLASTTPVFYLDKGGSRAVGYDAEILPRVADVYLKFRDDCSANKKPVPGTMDHVVKACDIVMRGLAHVGITALVDEATGHQDFRARDALAKILEAFVAKELRKWVRTFPLDYFKEMCRLQNKEFRPDMKLPPYFGHLTNDVIYSRLAPGVLSEVQRRNPTQDSGRRRHKNFQLLTEGIGHPKLLSLLGSVVTLMKLSTTWEDFKEKLDRIHRPFQDPKEIPLFAAQQEAESK